MTAASSWRIWTAALAGGAGALFLALPAAAVPTLYHSAGDTGADPGGLAPALPNTGPRTVYLYLNPGPTETTPGQAVCDNGDGDETCGVHFRITVTGGLSIAGFTPDAGVSGVRSRNTGTELTAAIVSPADPILSGPQRIGALTIDGAGGSGELQLLETVDASLDLQRGAPRELFFVPEPDGGLLLVTGVAGLAGLARFREALRRGR